MVPARHREGHLAFWGDSGERSIGAAPRIAVTVIVVALVGLAGTWALFRTGHSPAASPAACERGVNWQQRTSPYVAGTVVQSAEGQVGVIEGGALIGVRSPKEFAASRLGTIQIDLSNQEFARIDRVPHDGLVLQERKGLGSKQRLYLAMAGAVYQVRKPASLRGLGLDPDHATTIPAYGLDGAPRIPPSGSLLQVGGHRPVWVIEGGARHVTTACGDAHINVLPDDSTVLNDIPSRGAVDRQG